MELLLLCCSDLIIKYSYFRVDSKQVRKALPFKFICCDVTDTEECFLLIKVYRSVDATS